MSNKRIYYWFLYLIIVVLATYVFKSLQQTSLFEDKTNKYAAWIIYGIVVLAGYKNFVYDPRNKNE
jgi:1-acyl-sn-glycerol-3-phosphate acyltransferase